MSSSEEEVHTLQDVIASSKSDNEDSSVDFSSSSSTQEKEEEESKVTISIEEDEIESFGCWKTFKNKKWKDQLSYISGIGSYVLQFFAVIFALVIANQTGEISDALIYTTSIFVFLAVATNGGLGFKMVAIIFSLFFFFISIELIANGGKLVVAQGNFFDPVNENPVAGLVVGIFITAIIQSSSTTTSITVTLVGANIITLRGSIPIIMGANIGTSVTNTILAAGALRGATKNAIQRLFAAATVHDFFNLLSVLFFFPLEIITRSPPGSEGYLESIALGLGDLFFGSSGGNSFESPFKEVTKPLVNSIVVIDKAKFANATSGQPFEGSLIIGGGFKDSGLSDPAAGILIAILGLVFLLVTLTILVKSLAAIAKHSSANLIKYSSKSPGFINLAFGIGLTMLIQSSSVITSIMVPLVGISVISLDTMYPVAIGANIGTTLTAILAALVAAKKNALEAGFAHFMFNVSGTFVFYVLPWAFYYLWKWTGEFFVFYPIQLLRRAPIRCAEILAGFVSKRLWIGPLYIFIVFFAVPGILLGLSFGGVSVFFGIFVPVLVFTLVLVGFIILKKKKPQWLPKFLRDLSWASDPIEKIWEDKFAGKWNSTKTWFSDHSPDFVKEFIASWTITPENSTASSSSYSENEIELSDKNTKATLTELP